MACRFVYCPTINWPVDVLLQVCGRRSPNITTITPYIVNGQQAALGAWPWQILLKLNGDFQCGGVVINNRWILTAAHCIEDEILYVLLGTSCLLYMHFISVQCDSSLQCCVHFNGIHAFSTSCCFAYTHRRRKLLGRASRGPPTFGHSIRPTNT